MNQIYKDNGFENRQEYLQHLADEYGLEYSTVLLVANTCGPNEDFDGLINLLEDMVS